MEVSEAPKPVERDVVDREAGSHSDGALDPVHAEPLIQAPPALRPPNDLERLGDGSVHAALARHTYINKKVKFLKK